MLLRPHLAISGNIPYRRCFTNIQYSQGSRTFTRLRSFATQPPKIKHRPVQNPPKSKSNGNSSTENNEMSPSQRMFGWKLFAIGSTCLSFYFVFGRSITNEGSGMGEILGPPSSTLAPRTFVHGTVLSVKPSPPEEGSKASHVIVKMSFPRQHLPKDGSHYTNAIHHVYIKDDDMQIERPYTPILGLGLDGKMEFWVKKYPRGEVSNWISRLMRGRNIEIRGPIQQWDWRANPYDEIIMIAGGTGVTAFTQLLHQALFSSQPVSSPVNSNTHFTLLHGHQSPSQLPPSIITDEFEIYRESVPDRFTERVFIERVDNEADDPPKNVSLGLIDKDVLEKVLVERGILIDPQPQPQLPSTTSPSMLERVKGLAQSKVLPPTKPKVINPKKSVMVLVCGPGGMLTAFTGPKVAPGSNPSIGGALKELGLNPSQVQRLDA